MLNTILVFLELPSIPLAWADSRVLRLLFQNLVVEERPDIRIATTKCWKACLAYSSQDDDRLILDAGSHLSKWFAILTTPIGVPIESSLFWSAKVSLSGQAGYIHNVDKAMLAQDLSLVKEDSIIRVRVAGAEALGYLMSVWPTHVSKIPPKLFCTCTLHLVLAPIDSIACIPVNFAQLFALFECFQSIPFGDYNIGIHLH